MGGPDAGVDVAAVGLGADHRDRRAERAERGRRRHRTRRRARSRARPRARRTACRRRLRPRGARRSRRPRRSTIERPARARRPRRSGASPARIASRCASTAASVSSRSLRPPGSKSLTPLSENGLWLAEIIAPAAPVSAHAPARPGVGSTPSRHASPPARGDAVDERVLELGPGLAWVPRDRGTGPRCRSRPTAAAPSAAHDLRGELGARDPADAVGAEARRHAGAPASTAWSTAAPCAPS